jgi:pimeloyl-ACP methyl ester carboxylesterase
LETKIPYKNIALNANIFFNKNSKKCILFLCGGSLNTGKERFLGWQCELEEVGVSSVAFDYVGTPGTRDTVSNSSLQSRIKEVATVISWIKDEVKPEELIIYGVSMGGYIALGATALLPGAIGKLVLHAPAAYTKTAQGLLFDTTFTDAISQPESWSDSLSFSWADQFGKPVLFFQPEYDEVIPDKITERYVSIGNKKSNFTHVYLRGAGHNCWGNSESDSAVRKEVSAELVSFIKNS